MNPKYSRNQREPINTEPNQELDLRLSIEAKVINTYLKLGITSWFEVGCSHSKDVVLGNIGKIPVEKGKC